MTNAIVTGPTGAIGVALIQELIRHDIYVYAVCRKNSPRIANIPSHRLVEVITCDLDELNTLTTKINCVCDLFYHFGWMATIGDGRNDTDLQLQNIQYTLDAVNAAHQLNCKRFIGAGSQAEYGRVEGKIAPRTPTFPENGYGIAKLCAGQLSRIRCEQFDMEHIWARILSVYGPFDGPRTMISSTIEALLDKDKPALTLGIQQWDYLYSKDAANAFYLLGKYGVPGKTYCIGSGQAVELRQYIETLRDQIDPLLPLGFGEIPYGDKQVMHLEADINDLHKDTGFVPQYSFEKGINETIEWFKSR